MEKESANKVLLSVCAVAKPGEYVIMNRSELGQNLPEPYDKKEIDRAMMQLQADDLVSVRYSDADVYCLSVLNKGFVFGEKLKEKEVQRAEEERRKQDNSLVGQVAAEDGTVTSEIALAEEKEESVVPYRKMVFPWTKLFLVCAGGAFLGGLIAGAIVFLVTKLF